MRKLLLSAAAAGILASAVSAEAAADADLVVTNVSASATQAVPDEQIAVDCDVLNQGSAPAGASRLKYYFSTDPILDAGDTYRNYDDVVGLGVGQSGSESANVRVPAGTPDGHYFILVVADYDEEVAESDEGNNVFALPVTVGNPVASTDPDLRVSGVSISTGLSGGVVRAGEAVDVTAQVVNDGAGPAPTVDMKYVLSTDTAYDAGDKQLSYDQNDSLEAGAVSLEEASLNITTATAAGDYYLLFVVDADDVAAESDEGNNVFAVPLTVTKDDPNGILPDLVLDGPTLSASTAPAGEKVSVTVSVENVGVAPAGGSRLKYYFSTDDEYDGADTYLNYDAVAGLAIGESVVETANLTIPAVPDGPAYLLLVADETEEVAERYESNNVVALPFIVGFVATGGPGDDPGADLPDIVAADAWVDTSVVKAGERLMLHSTIQNVGSQPSVTSKSKYYFSRNAQYDGEDTYLSYDTVAALAPGQTSSEDVNPKIPEDAGHGTWHLLVVTDANDDVAESMESNNVEAIAIHVTVDDPSLDAADLMADSPVLSKAVVGAGHQLEVDTTVHNVGTQPSAASRLKLYLSDDLLLDSEDAFLDHRPLEGMPVGASLPVSARVRVPMEAGDGGHHVLVVVDSYDEVLESYESNNLMAIPVTVGPDAGPNPVYPYACPSTVFTDPHLLGQHTVATFNALHLGWNNAKDMLSLACVVSHFDLVGLVEIDDPQGLIDLELELESLTSEGWSSHVSPWAVGNANGTEFYGYVWRDAEVTMTGSLGFFDDPSDDLKREPYAANFQMGSFDLTLVVFHLQYGDTIATRRGEAQHLVDVYDYFQNLNGAEQDVLIGGDFNLPADDDAFTLIDFRDVAFITDPEQKTSIGPLGLSNSFDNIFYPAADTTERLDSGAHDFTMGNYLLVGDTVSDHLPVWISVDTSSDDD